MNDNIFVLHHSLILGQLFFKFYFYKICQVYEFNTNWLTKIHNNINIAGGAEVISYHRSKKTDRANMIFSYQLWLELCKNLLYSIQFSHGTNIAQFRFAIATNVRGLANYGNRYLLSPEQMYIEKLLMKITNKS